MCQVLYEQKDAVAFVTLNRPEKLNALTPEMVVRLARIWTEIADTPTVRVVLLTGAGTRAFCAGADLRRLIPLLTRARQPEDEWDEQFLADRDQINRALLKHDFFKPIVLAINGDALAGGTELLLATDIRIASSEATFGLTEVRRGLIPGGGSTARLARQVSWADAMEIILVGEAITAEHALRAGLVNRVVPADQVLPVAEEFARRVAKGGPLALAKVKEAMVRSNGRPLVDAFAIETDCWRDISRSNDAKEGPRAFAEKREPLFTGR